MFFGEKCHNIPADIVRDHLVDHLVIGVVLYRGLLHRDSTLHLYSNQVLGMKWRFGLSLAADQVAEVRYLASQVGLVLIGFSCFIAISLSAF